MKINAARLGRDSLIESSRLAARLTDVGRIQTTRRSLSAMTLVEILIVSSIISVVSVALFSLLSHGLKVWERSRQMVIEQDIALFFDRISLDLHNACYYSMIRPEGNEYRFSFPAVISVAPDAQSGHSSGSYIDQIGRVEYYFDPIKDVLFRRAANYGQSLKGDFSAPQKMVYPLDNVKFSYYYLSGKEELYASDVLDVFPAVIEITIEFADRKGKRVLQKFVDLPIGS